MTVEQFRALCIVQKPVDIVVEPFNLFVEVDGSQHAASSTGFGQAAGEQCERDKQFDAAVLRTGGRLLRLHCLDVASWPSHIQAALKRAKEQPGSSFVYYSASYPAQRRVQ